MEKMIKTEINKRAQSLNAFYGDDSFRDLGDDSMLQGIDELVEFPEDESHSIELSINEGNSALDDSLERRTSRMPPMSKADHLKAIE